MTDLFDSEDSPMSTPTSLDEHKAAWTDAHARLFRFLEALDVSEDTRTTTVRLIPKAIDSPEIFRAWLDPQVSQDGRWLHATTGSKSSTGRFGYALPIAPGNRADGWDFPLLEVHTLLVAWWLTNAWRARQLAMAASSLAASDEWIAAAACVRPLIETAAALWVDGRKLASAWNDIKLTGARAGNRKLFARYVRLTEMVNEVTLGAKFDDRVPNLKRTWGRFERSNVLGHVDKLAKALHGGYVQDDYQWLCNTVHPSIGNTFAFSSPFVTHRTHTFALTFYRGRPIQIDDRGATHAETTVQLAVTRGAATALRAIQTTLDAALRSLDDLALTTRVPTMCREQYWRKLLPPGRNDPCPCRSGRKAKHCTHAWGEPAPSFPADLDQP